LNDNVSGVRGGPASWEHWWMECPWPQGPSYWT